MLGLQGVGLHVHVLADHHLYVHTAGLVPVSALALKDQLKLRALLLVGITFSALAHLVGLKQPAWPDLFWNGVSFAINIFVLTQLVLDRTHVGLSREQGSCPRVQGADARRVPRAAGRGEIGPATRGSRTTEGVLAGKPV